MSVRMRHTTEHAEVSGAASFADPNNYVCRPFVHAQMNGTQKPVNLSLQRHYSFLDPNGQSLSHPHIQYFYVRRKERESQDCVSNLLWY
jgi:hypothetical protein